MKPKSYRLVFALLAIVSGSNVFSSSMHIEGIISVSITKPATNNTSKAGSDILVEANASASEGTIKKVSFYEGTNLIGEDSTLPYSIIWPTVETGTYSITCKATDNNNVSATSGAVTINVIGCVGFGTITREVLDDLGGARVEILTSNPRFPNRPSFVSKIGAFEGDTNSGDNYGSRLAGYLCAPQTGDYVFTIAADDRGELWLSKNEDTSKRVKIAEVLNPVKFREYKKYPEQTSVKIRLVKGGRYYVEALHKEAIRVDHISVAWTLPDNTIENPIPGSRLSPWYQTYVTGLPDESASGNLTAINAFPVPAKDKVSITFNANAGAPAYITLHDALSNELMKMPFNSVSGFNEVTLTLDNNVKAGIYFIQITSGADRYVKKIIVGK